MIVRISADLTPTGVTTASSLDTTRNHLSGILTLQEHFSGILKYWLISSRAFAGIKVHVDPPREAGSICCAETLDWMEAGREEDVN